MPQMTICRVHFAYWISKALPAHACAHAHVPAHPHTHTHTHTHTGICHIHCFSTTMVSWTRLNVTLYVHCLSCNVFYRACLIPIWRCNVSINLCIFWNNKKCDCLSCWNTKENPICTITLNWYALQFFSRTPPDFLVISKGLHVRPEGLHFSRHRWRSPNEDNVIRCSVSV